MSTRRRYRTAVLIVDAIIAVVCVVGLYHVSQKAGIPVVLDEEGGKVFCVEVADPVYRSLFTPGDRIVALGGRMIHRMEDVEFLLDARRIGDVVEFLVGEGENQRSVSAVLSNYYDTFYLVVATLVGLPFYLMGLFVYLRRPGDTAAVLFHWGSMCTVVMMLTTWGRYTIEPVEVGIALRAIFFLAHAFLSVIFFHFTLVFPRPKWESIRSAIGVLYAVAFGLAVWTIVTFFDAAAMLSVEKFGESLLAFFISRWFLVGLALIGLASMVHSYFTALEEFERKKLRWVLWGLLIGFPPYLLLWVIPQIVLKQGLVREEVVLLFSGIIPVTFAISIVRYRLMDIDLIINRSIVYGLVMSLVFGVYAGIVGLSALVVTSFTIEFSVVVSAVAAIVVAILFTPVRDTVQKFVDKRFFRVHYDFRETQRKFLEEIKGSIDLQRLAEAMVNRIDGFLAVERVGLFVITGEGRRLKLLAHKHYDILETHGVRFEADRLRASFRVPVSLPGYVEHGVAYEPADADVFARWGIAIVFGIISEEGELLGFIVVGQKKSGRRFTAEDIDLLTSVSAQAGTAIERITLQQKLLLEHEEKRRLEELNQLKSYFVSGVSHDLRTPLTSIKVFAEMLRQRKRIPRRKAQEYLEIIEGESDRLTRLINNVLDFAKVEKGMMEYNFSNVRLNDVVRGVLRSMRYQFVIQGYTVRSAFNAGGMVYADPDAVAEALINILSNAIKYSTERKYISVTTFRRNGFAGVRVEDRGVGIPSEEIQRIFEPFYRSKNVMVSQSSGVGLGLALVKHTMDAHRGTVTVKSTPGRGSTFTLLFPLKHEKRSPKGRS